MAIDFLGQNLNIGDDVIFLNYNGTSANLERGKITKVFPHTAEIGRKRRAEYKIIKILTDTAPVVHGWWGADETCSVCGEKSTEGLDATKWDYWLPDYCPHCGAKMDGGADNG